MQAHPVTSPMDGRVAATPMSQLRRRDGAAVVWRCETEAVAYPRAVAAMEARVAAIRSGEAPELVWLLEHPPLYTAGTGARGATPASPLPFPLFESGRGGQLTYHGPGQRIGYVLLDLAARGADVRAYVAALERWLVAALARLGVVGERRDDRVGVWVRRPGGPHGALGEPAEDKIAALGVRVRRGVAFHGVSLNVAPDLRHFAAIVPCGISAGHLGVTSLAALGVACSTAEVDAALRDAFAEVFG